MLRFTTLFSIVALVSLALWATGCGPTKQEPDSSHDEHGEHDHSSHEHGAAGSDKTETNLAKLPAEERAAAEKQKICPVSEKPLGSMGVPIKLDVEGKTVFICCPACEKPLRENPEKYLGS